MNTISGYFWFLDSRYRFTVTLFFSHKAPLFRTPYEMLDSLIYGSLSVGGEMKMSVMGLWGSGWSWFRWDDQAVSDWKAERSS